MRYLFGDYTLDEDRRELCRAGQPVHVEPQVFDLLLYVIRNRGRVVTKDDLMAGVWGGRVVAESTLGNRINAARHVIGDSGERQQFIRTVSRRGIMFVGDVRDEEAAAAAPAANEVRQADLSAPAIHSQEVTFCQTPDGVHLAVATSGSGHPVVKAGNWLSHVEFDWQSPVSAPLLTLLSNRFRLVRYDSRGNGLSDWDVQEISFDAWVQDLETVVDALGLDRFALFGISQGAAVSIAYAARHPDRVSRLVLSGSYVRGWARRGNADEIARRATLVDMIRTGWGQDNPAFRQVFTSLYMPEATVEQMRAFDDLQRISVTPENAVRVAEAVGAIDVSALLPSVVAPTLIMHSRDDGAAPFALGLELARTIPNARLVALESRSHVILPHEPAWERFTQELCDFLAGADAE